MLPQPLQDSQQQHLVKVNSELEIKQEPNEAICQAFFKPELLLNVAMDNGNENDDNNDDINNENNNQKNSSGLYERSNSPLSYHKFRSQFQVIEQMGKDGQIYAVKQVNSNNKITVLDEAHTFAQISKLYHPNIVRYYSSWIEVAQQTKHRINNQSTRTSDPYEFSHNNIDDYSLSSGDQLEISDSNSASKSYNMLYGENKFCFYLYIQMEYCDTSLDKWLLQRNDLQDQLSSESIENSISISKQLIRAVAYLHHQDIIHMDLRPANVFLNINPLQVKIGDFGMSLTPNNLQKVSNNNLGAYYYLPPENEISFKRDVFAFGVMLYEVFTIFKTAAERHHVLKSIHDECALPACFDKSTYLLWQISKMVSKDPTDRPDLREILAFYNDFDNQSISNNSVDPLQIHSEVQQLKDRIKFLESLLLENGIKCP